MIDRAATEQIIAQYTKHGWKLRRVLLSDDLSVNRIKDIFAEAEVFPSKLDAVWFSRSSKPDTAAWELRHLAETPYSLVTGVPEGTPETEVEAILGDTEAKMLEVLGQKKA